MEEKENLQAEKTGLDEKRKTALLRYVAILFAVAFLLVLLSMFRQMRTNKSTISELSQSSISALQKTEQLQEVNQSLSQTNEELQQDKKYLQQQVEQLTKYLEEQTALLKELEGAPDGAAIMEAYEALLTALDLGEVSEDLKTLKENLGEKGLEAYESLLQEGE